MSFINANNSNGRRRASRSKMAFIALVIGAAALALGGCVCTQFDPNGNCTEYGPSN